MDKSIVAVVQNKLIATKTLDELSAYYHRFLRIAKSKGSQLVVFPELSGLAVGIPLFPGWRNALLKEAATPKSGLLPRLKGMLAGSAANVVRADLRKSLQMTLSQMPEALFDTYSGVFSDLARQYGITLVAGSLYRYDEASAGIQHVACVFGPDGRLLGQQAQVVADPETLDLAHPGPGWQTIETPVGRIGILFGYEALYPEPARVLAYQGADMLLTLAATRRPAIYHKIRQAALARSQENQLYGLVSFLVGPDPFAGPETPPFLGKSAIFAPLDFTSRFTGIMTELGSPQAEGVVTAEWDFMALRDLWASSETPLRREMPLQQVGGLLAQVYGSAQTLDVAATHLQLAAPAEEAASETPLLSDSETESSPATEEDELISLVTPILPTEPPVIPLSGPEEEFESDLAASDAIQDVSEATEEESASPDEAETVADSAENAL